MKDNLARKPQLTVVDNSLTSNTKVKATPLATVVRLKTKIKPPYFNDETARWLSSLLIVVLVYSAPLIWWMIPNDHVGLPTPPPAAMMVEIAPTPIAPKSKPDLAPGPEQMDIPPPKPEPKPLPKPEVETEVPPAPPALKPEVVVKPKPEIKQEEEPLPEETPEPIEEEPEVIPEPVEEKASIASAPPKAELEDTKAAAPNQGVSTPAQQNNQKLTWQNALMIKLNEAKRYPSRARRYRHEGVGYLRFSMDREGNVLSKSIEQSSGHEMLDNETLELIERAQPLPIPPNHIKGESLEFVVPIVFSLRN